MAANPGVRRSRRNREDTSEAQQALCRMASMPGGPERSRVREYVIRRYLPMADRLSRRFRNRGEPEEDLRQVARLGLVKAVDRYDPERAIAFESFAVPTVVGEIKRHFRDYGWSTHVPRRQQELRNTVRLARQELMLPAGDRETSVEQLARSTGLSEEEVRLGLSALDAYTAVSLDAPGRGETEQPLLDTLGGEDVRIDKVIDLESLKPLVARLPCRERKILFLRFFRDLTQREIAEEIGISQMHVSRLITRTCRRLNLEMRDGTEGEVWQYPSASPSAA
jgi:RNA polymerase sigma-B factor